LSNRCHRSEDGRVRQAGAGLYELSQGARGQRRRAASGGLGLLSGPLLAHRVDIGMSAFAPLLGAKRT